jgi:hypothetical protein
MKSLIFVKGITYFTEPAYMINWFVSITQCKHLRIVYPVLTYATALLLSGCLFMHRDFANYDKNYKRINLHRIAVGMNKNDVEAVLGSPSNAIGSKRVGASVVEVWAYERWDARVGFDQKAEEYWLYFANGRLSQWGRPCDWERAADKVHEVRFR